jgi:TolB protein
MRFLALAPWLLVSPLLCQQPPSSNGGGHPSVSPDGRRIAFLAERGGVSDIYAIGADGSGLERLTTDSTRKGVPFWTPDGNRIGFTMTSGDTVRVFLMSATGGQPTEVSRLQARGSVRLLPDGEHLLLGVGSWTAMQLVTADLDGSNRRPLTADQAAYWCPNISPRSHRIAVGRTDSAGMQVWVMNPDGSNPHAVTSLDGAQGTPQCPAWSPDERRLAVQREERAASDTSKYVGSIWLIDLETGAATRLAPHTTPYQDEVPAWFPDGKRIAFQSNRTGRWEVWVMNADGTNPKQLTR